MPALSPAVVAAIGDLELAARLVVEGLRTGGNRSPFHGYSTEFRQHRSYRAGDDLKHLDWKVFARTDRLYTRQFRETTNLSVMLVLDTSASMAFPADVAGESLSKFRYSTIATAALAYLASEQGNAVGLMTASNGVPSFVGARGGRPHLRSLLARIDKLESGGSWDPARMITRASQLLRRRGVMIVISDFYDAEEETRGALRRAVRRGHDVSMVQLLSPAELSFPYTGHVELADLESGRLQLTDATASAARYREQLRAFLARARQEALRAGIDYALVSTDTPPEAALRTFLRQRGVRSAAAHAPHAVQR